MPIKFKCGLFYCILFVIFSQTCLYASDLYIPEALVSWKDWVLYGKEHQQCPTKYNDANENYCQWPYRLNLTLENKQGVFSQEWDVFAPEWIPLPGNSDMWPIDVKVNGKDFPVADVNNIPSVFLQQGHYKIEGSFLWDNIPVMMNIPPETGLMQLTINNNLIQFPQVDKDGHVWLQKEQRAKLTEDKLYLNVSRLIQDTIPLQMITHLKLSISGTSREETLLRIIPEKCIPVSVSSVLPIRFNSKGDIVMQVRPGQWDIEITGRFLEPISNIVPTNITGPQEIWSFEAQNHLRMVNIEGIASVDPHKTDIPPAWKSFPTYIVTPKSEIVFKEQRRGDPDPAPNRLNLHRTMWLDFNGKGYTINDDISGTINKDWRLNMNPSVIPGRVAIDGEDQLITQFGDNASGVEVRRGNIKMVSDYRYEASKNVIPALGWDHDFDSVSTTLNLPCGWRLITASGVDTVSGAWLEKWTLLDFFLVFIIAMIFWKMKSLFWGIIALTMMVLVFHEHNSPCIVWLHVLASTALLSVVPKGKFNQLISLWRIGSLIALIVISIPFMIHQIRIGMFPQLEEVTPTYSTVGTVMQAPDNDVQTSDEDTISERIRAAAPMRKLEVLLDEKDKELKLQEPNALIQTGPGLPSWSWKTVVMNWNGPVEKNQQISLWLISPLVNMCLMWLQVLLLSALIARVVSLKAINLKVS